MYIFTLKDSGPEVRIDAKGCPQVHGVDYGETYAPVVSFTSVRIMLARVAVGDIELHQMDIVTAVLHGDLDKEISMEIPAGFKDSSRPNLLIAEGILQPQASSASLARQNRCVLVRRT